MDRLKPDIDGIKMWRSTFLSFLTRVARFFFLQHTKTGKCIPNNYKMYQMAIKYKNGCKIYQHLPLQDPPKFTQIWIFGLKRNHLATLIDGIKNPEVNFSVNLLTLHKRNSFR
jgi:hypothetical protein